MIKLAVIALHVVFFTIAYTFTLWLFWLFGPLEFDDFVVVFISQLGMWLFITYLWSREKRR